jgi:transposase
MVAPVKVDPRLKERIVLDVLRERLPIAAAARKHGVHANTVQKWKKRYTDAGLAALTSSDQGSGTEVGRLRAQVGDLTTALGEAAVELRALRQRA